MQWVIVSLDGDEVLVMGEFDCRSDADKYVEESYGDTKPTHKVVTRPILEVEPMCKA